jgi:hypothetical protein
MTITWPVPCATISPSALRAAVMALLRVPLAGPRLSNFDSAFRLAGRRLGVTEAIQPKIVLGEVGIPQTALGTAEKRDLVEYLKTR